ncbi:MAG: PQQ-like beta-propeller repeat protein [Rickettsiales bacterium]|jgi:outer membrane protein assembly factor BamB|nr:PQQ-like beta-propeller repeat protein [Rickettsiales bacterium]
MKNFIFYLLIFILVSACGKTDPILPGTRTAIFPRAEITILNKEVPMPQTARTPTPAAGMRQTANNKIMNADGREVFSGFPTDATVAGMRTPMQHGGFVFAGLSTGEVVKFNPKTRIVQWIADVYSSSAMTGGNEVLDIVASVQPYDEGVYAGGLGGEFCKLNIGNGGKVWCVPISVGADFVITKDFAFVISADNYLYAIELKSGAVYWKKPVEKQTMPDLIKN